MLLGLLRFVHFALTIAVAKILFFFYIDKIVSIKKTKKNPGISRPLDFLQCLLFHKTLLKKKV